MKVRLIIVFILLIFSANAYSQSLKVGDKAPEIIQNYITGEEFKLSDLRGKMVLIDFWASWCKPCRKENPFLVEVYKKYKDENFKKGESFTIVSISLDFKKEAWEKAIKADQLEWSHHVSDMKGWRNEAAQIFKVKSIPAGFLINGEGTIIGVNLRSEELASILKKERKKKSLFSSRD